MAPKNVARSQICILLLCFGMVLSATKKVNFRVITDYNCWNFQTREIMTCVTANIENANLVNKGDSVEFKQNENSSKPLTGVEKVFFYNDLEEDNKNSINFLPMNEISLKFTTADQLQCYRLHTKVINSTFFNGNPNDLKVFTFSAGKEIINVGPNAFKNVKKLKKVTMTHNQLIIHQSAFVGLKDLEDLDLSFNYLANVIAAWFQDLRELKGLDLSNNEIKEVEPGMLQNLNKLSNLRLEMNKCIDTNYDLTNPTEAEIDSVLAPCYPKESQIISITPRTISNIIKPDSSLFTPKDLGACILSSIPNGRLKNLESGAFYKSGQEIDTNVVIQVQCNKGFELNVNQPEDNKIGCSKNVFKKPFPKCIAVKVSGMQPIKSTKIISTFPISTTPLPKTNGATIIRTKTTRLTTTTTLEPETTLPSEPETTIAPESEITEVPAIPEVIIVDDRCPGKFIVDHTMESTCLLNFKKVECDITSHEAGTEVTMHCKPGYNAVGIETLSRSICQPDGSWNETPPTCRPSCGLSNENLEGKTKTIAPWHVAIYRKEAYICGGSIVSERVIISAAHCFNRQVRNSVEIENKELFKIVAGKNFKTLYAFEPHKTQTFGVAELRAVDGYTGNVGYFVGNIAVVVLSAKIQFNEHISPICLDYESRLSVKSQLPVGLTGMVAGWGWDKYNESTSDELKTLKMPVVSFKECKESAAEFEPFITTDKFCAGEANGYGTCNGDTGGGLMFKKTVGETSAYYLRGVVSNSKFVPRSCDVLFYTLLTNVHTYIDIIQETVEDYS